MKLNVADACQILNVDPGTLYRWIGEDELPALWWNSRPYFHPTKILEWATLRNRRFSAAIFRGNNDFKSSRLGEALRRGGVFHDVAGEDPRSLLSNVVARLRLPEDFDRAALAELIVIRQTFAATGIGGGIAIPHPLHPIIVPGFAPAVTLCFTQQPVPFGAKDGQPVTALFSVIAPNVPIHLHLLARLAMASRDLGFLQCLRLQQSDELIFAELERHEAKLTTGSVSLAEVSTYTPSQSATDSGVFENEA